MEEGVQVDISDQGNKTCNGSMVRESFACSEEFKDQCGSSRASQGRNGRDELGKGQIRQGILGHGGDFNFSLSAKENNVIGRF